MKTLLILLLMLPFSLFAQKNAYQISLNIKGAKGHTFYLMPIYGGLHNRDNIKPIDSIFPETDTFSLKGRFNDLAYYTLVKDSTRLFYPIILDTGIIRIEGNADSTVNTFNSYSYQNDILHDFGKEINPIIETLNESCKNQDMVQYESSTKMLKDTIIFYARKYPASYGIFSTASTFMNIDTVWGKKAFLLFSDIVTESEWGKQLRYQLYTYSATSFINSSFPTIKIYNLNKTPTQVVLKKNKIYLIDYWASWCTPCIKKLPELKKIYGKYKSKGFEIISFSLDLNYEAWVKAVKKHRIDWSNYASLKGDEAEDAKYFNINSIPYTILVGKGNKIIKLNPTEEEVEAYLKKNKTN